MKTANEVEAELREIMASPTAGQMSARMRQWAESASEAELAYGPKFMAKWRALAEEAFHR